MDIDEIKSIAVNQIKAQGYDVLKAQVQKLQIEREQLRAALGTLVNEAKHFRRTRQGLGFLNDAIIEADLVLDNVRKNVCANLK